MQITNFLYFGQPTHIREGIPTFATYPTWLIVYLYDLQPIAPKLYAFPKNANGQRVSLITFIG